MLRFDTRGYIFICTLPSENWKELKDAPVEFRARRKISVKNLGTEKSGRVLLQVTGRWLGANEKIKPDQKKAYKFFKEMERSPIYGLDTPEITTHGIAFEVAAEAEKIRQLLQGLKSANVPFKITKLGRLKSSSKSVLDQLTLQQSRVLTWLMRWDITTFLEKLPPRNSRELWEWKKQRRENI